uniref:Uncharacterized protein n=1 Tax=Mimivirus LCMiAC01 TaxID=2506608 RepID=A0A481Z057_9VIRU|nr:MAG: hypothetical protein LCMiAC01_05740 [Mimivirus LCMiAC01]
MNNYNDFRISVQRSNSLLSDSSEPSVDRIGEVFVTRLALPMHSGLIIYILQIITLYNAVIKGWKIKKIGSHKYILSKHIENIEHFKEHFELKSFINNIVKLNID